MKAIPIPIFSRVSKVALVAAAVATTSALLDVLTNSEQSRFHFPTAQLALSAVAIILLLVDAARTQAPTGTAPPAAPSLLLNTAILAVVCACGLKGDTLYAPMMMLVAAVAGAGAKRAWLAAVVGCAWAVSTARMCMLVSQLPAQLAETILSSVYLLLACVCLIAMSHHHQGLAPVSYRRSDIADRPRASPGMEHKKLRKMVTLRLDQVLRKSFAHLPGEGSSQGPGSGLQSFLAKTPAVIVLNLLGEMAEDSRISVEGLERVDKMIELIGHHGRDMYSVMDGDLEKELEGSDNDEIDGDTKDWLRGLLHGGGDAERRHVQNLSGKTAGITRLGRQSTFLGKNRKSFFEIEDAEGEDLPCFMYGQIEGVLSRISTALESLDADVLEIASYTDGWPLYHIGVVLFRKYNLLEKFDIEEDLLSNLLVAIEKGYNDCAYHNKSHAADVAAGLSFYITNGSFHALMTDVEVFASIFAALVHDLDHPGLNNAYHVESSSPLAIMYNDNSVLENHHISKAFNLLGSPKTDIIKHLSPRDYSRFRRVSIEMVLNTDLERHFDFVTEFKSYFMASKPNLAEPDNRVMILKMALKCADLGHTVKLWGAHRKWSELITDEMLSQGDLEKKNNYKQVSPFMDRTTHNLARSQVGFLSFLVKPMMLEWSSFFTAIDLNQRLQANLAIWESKLSHHPTPMRAPKKDPTSPKSSSSTQPTPISLIPQSTSKIKTASKGTSNGTKVARHATLPGSMTSPKGSKGPSSLKNLAI